MAAYVFGIRVFVRIVTQLGTEATVLRDVRIARKISVSSLMVTVSGVAKTAFIKTSATNRVCTRTVKTARGIVECV